MKDGYASLQNAETEEQARLQAIEACVLGTQPLGMTRKEKREATTVDYVENLSARAAS